MDDLNEQLANKLWRKAMDNFAKRKVGRPPKFESVEALAEACIAYFEWAENNPLRQQRVYAYKGTLTKGLVTKPRALTMAGLFAYTDISPQVWKDWRESRPEFSDLQDQVERIIWEQKFVGAASDIFNHFIIARELGLADRQEVKTGVTVNIEGDDADL